MADEAPKTPTEIALDKIYKIADMMAVHYHALHQTCTALLARAGSEGPPYSMQIAAYREMRHESIKTIEDRVKQTIKEHQAPKIIKAANHILGPDGKKLN